MAPGCGGGGWRCDESGVVSSSPERDPFLRRSQPSHPRRHGRRGQHQVGQGPDQGVDAVGAAAGVAGGGEGAGLVAGQGAHLVCGQGPDQGVDAVWAAAGVGRGWRGRGTRSGSGRTSGLPAGRGRGLGWVMRDLVLLVERAAIGSARTCLPRVARTARKAMLGSV